METIATREHSLVEQIKIREDYNARLKIILKEKFDHFIVNTPNAQMKLCDILEEKTGPSFWVDNHLALDDIADELNITRPDLPCPITTISAEKVKKRCIKFLRNSKFECLEIFLLKVTSDGSLDHSRLRIF